MRSHSPAKISGKGILRAGGIQDEGAGHLTAEGDGCFEAGTVGRHDDVRLHGLDIGYRALNNLGLGVDEMEASHNGVELVRAGAFLRLSDGIDDTGMGATGEDHQSFAFDLEKERLLTREGIRFEIIAALNEKRLGNLFIGGNPLDVAGKIGAGDDLNRVFHFNHLEPESLEVFFF